MVAMARARNDAQFAHECALIAILGNALTTHPKPPGEFKPMKELDHDG